MRIVHKQGLNLSANMVNFIFVDNIGYNSFKIVRQGELDDRTNWVSDDDPK